MSNSTARWSETSVGINAFLGAGLFVSVVVAAAIVFHRDFFSKCHTVIGICVWLFLMLSMYLLLIKASRTTVKDDIPMVFYVIFVTHTLLPINHRLSIFFGSLTGIVDLVISVIYALLVTKLLAFPAATAAVVQEVGS